MTPRPHSRPWRWIAVAAFLALALGGGVFAGRCRADEDDAERALAVPPRVTVKNGVTVVTLNAVTQQNGGIETARPEPPPAQDTVIGYGTVLDAGGLTELGNRYLDAKAQLEMAQAKLAVSRAAFERTTALYKDRQNMSAAQLQSAEGSFEIDRAALAAAQSHVSAVAASAQQIWGPVLGKALAKGAPLVARLIDRDDYLVKVTLPPGSAVAAPAEAASARLDDGSEVRLRFISPATSTDPKIQGISYFYTGPAASGLLPGVNVTASLPTGRVPEGVVVPAAAVVWLQGKAWLYLRTGAETFVRRQIAAAQAAPGGGYLVSGLAPDAQIVVRGAQMLLSEEFRAQVRSEEDER